jgi:hypothetical protein
MALVAGCGGIATTGSPTATTSTAVTTSTPAPADALAARAVKASCASEVPSAVSAVISDAKAVYVPKYALGSDCQWSSADYSRRIIAYAVTAMPYRNWAGMQGLTEKTTVSGYEAVRGHIDGNCVVLVDVQNVTLEVDLSGVGDPTCQTTTTLAEHVLDAD